MAASVVANLEDDFDFDSDGEGEKSELDRLFDHAVIAVRKRTKEISQNNLLYLYGRYKYVTEGPCNVPKPSGLFNFEAKSKWESWHQLGTALTKDQCKQEYIGKLDDVLKFWREDFVAAGTTSKADEKGTFGVRMSTMASGDAPLDKNDMNLFDFCREGLLDRLRAYFDAPHNREPHVVDQLDDNNMTMLMWACDRGNEPIVRYLVETCRANVNKQDSEGQTCLHYAASCEHVNLIKYLIEHSNIDRNLADNDGLTAKDVTENKQIIEILS